MNKVGYFSQDYQTARKRFLDAALASNASVESVKNPYVGADNQLLFMDVALIGSAGAERTLVLCSGTNGVEGFAGSGIQTGMVLSARNSALFHRPGGTSNSNWANQGEGHRLKKGSIVK